MIARADRIQYYDENEFELKHPNAGTRDRRPDPAGIGADYWRLIQQFDDSTLKFHYRRQRRKGDCHYNGLARQQRGLIRAELIRRLLKQRHAVRVRHPALYSVDMRSTLDNLTATCKITTER